MSLANAELEACRRLGWTHISAQYTDELDPKRLQLFEYEENIKRVDLTADEQCRALVGFHQLNVQLDPTWNQNKTADALHKSKSALSNDLRVAYAHVGGDKQICAATTMSAKRNILARRDERNTRLALAELDPTRRETILNFDFNERAKTYSGPRFNFLHCDFPYGIGADKFNQSSAPVHGDYDDRPEVFDRLCQTLRDNLDRLCEPSAHMIFWFAIKHYPKVYGFLQSLGADWAVNPVPLIWAKPGEGIIPRPEHDPRQCYEAAFKAHELKLVELGSWLRERRNRRKIPNRLEACGYVSVENPTTKDGHFVVVGRRQVIYARRDLTPNERIEAAEHLVKTAAI